jgi:site-specific DNA-methyltransferase (adenine-specific)
MAVRIEDAGFEIRDLIAWVYGSGFPKSMDVSNAIDKQAGAERTERLAPKPGHENFVGRDNLAGLRDGTIGQGEGGSARPWMNDPQKVENSHWDFAPATAEAKQWDGWGTALKPALEPVTVARKPLAGTVADNVQRYGTGGLNIDGCRVGTESTLRIKAGGSNQFPHEDDAWQPKTVPVGSHSGRWPANLIHDGSDEVLALFPQSKAGTETQPRGKGGIWSPSTGTPAGPQYGDTGSSARFFKSCPPDPLEDGRRFMYCAKASKRDRDEGLDHMPETGGGIGARHTMSGPMMANHTAKDGVSRSRPRANNHPTVKPTDLMRYLCRLVTPPGGVVLDPFMGSRSTGKATALEGFRFIGIEREAEYIAIAEARIKAAGEISMQNELDLNAP